MQLDTTKGSAMNLWHIESNRDLNPGEAWKAWRWYKNVIETVWVLPYDERTILDRLKSTIGTAQIPKSDVYEWWQNWIERQELPAAEKEAVQEELMMFASINGEPLETPEGKIKPKFLIAILQEMGVLKAN